MFVKSSFPEILFTLVKTLMPLIRLEFSLDPF